MTRSLHSTVRITFTLLIGFLVSTNVNGQNKPSHRAVFQDKEGVIRWSDNKKELSLFGANYCLPSACDYRAARYVTQDLKKIVDADMAHFARMGWDALRLCLWGDYENTDTSGNLIANDHLDLLDYVMFKAKERGIYFLLSPIVTYSSQFPDAMRSPLTVNGFSTYFKKGELGTNPRAIAAQQNYIRQLLNHVNPYTQIALKNDPSILFIEMINEPTHHSKDVEGSVKYINALVDAVRSTGCNKILFHNYTQDFNMAKPLGKSKIQGLTFAWYPTGLNSGKTLTGNYLPVVDHYSEKMFLPEISKLSRIVYEFDAPDLLNAYMYPAMARSFREVGAQFATMFSYDMIATAPYNLGWQTHCLNMIYTPQKAVSAIIAGEVMKEIPRFKNYGNYPSNTTFGAFSISYDKNLSVMNTAEKFMYGNNTELSPLNLSSLKQIVGYGSSPVVQYDGKGIYFLDKIKEGVWRLELYSDAVQVDDPYKMPSPTRLAFRSIHGTWPMTLNLPGVETFTVIPINEGNQYTPAVKSKSFAAKPGIFIITTDKNFKKESLPQSIGYVNMFEFHETKDQALPAQVVLQPQETFYAGKPIKISADVYGVNDIEKVTLYLKGGFRSVPVEMKKESGYTYTAELPANRSNEGFLDYCIVVKEGGQITNYPSGTHKSPEDWDYNDAGTWRASIVKDQASLRLLKPDEDASKLGFTRIGDGVRFGIYKLLPSAAPNGDASFKLELPLNYDKNLQDYTISVPVKEKIRSRVNSIAQAKDLLLYVRGVNQQQQSYITLVEKDGTSWTKKLVLDTDWKELKISLNDLVNSKGVLLPMGYPGEWKYWIDPAEGRGKESDRLKIEDVEWIQISVRQSDIKKENPTASSWIEISSASVQF